MVSSLNQQLALLGLEWNDLRLLLRLREGAIDKRRFFRVSNDRVQDAAESIFKENRQPADKRAAKRLLEEVGERLSIPLSLQALDSPWNHLFRYLKTILTITLFIFVSYIVIGGIATGHSRLLGADEPLAAIGILVLLIVALASLEGLQISITTLRMKDFLTLRSQYPRAASLYRKFREAKDTARFLAGRQLLVIIVVFFAAQLTSFPDLKTWPFTSASFPSWMATWFEVLLDLGILGALFVLWIGQLAPQFVANKHPVMFLNLIGMGLTLNVSFFVESLGLTRPGNWFSRLVGDGPSIQISSQEKYHQETSVVHGYGIIGLKKTWEVHRDKCTLFSQNLLTFTKSGFNEIIDSNLVIRGTSVRPTFGYELSGGQETLPNQEIYAERTQEERLPNGFRCFNQTLRPRYGSFKKGDVVCTKGTIVCPYVDIDQISISRPTQYILFRVRFCDEPSNLRRVLVTGYRTDEYLSNPPSFVAHELPLFRDEEGTISSEFMEMYPEVGTTYVFEWEVVH